MIIVTSEKCKPLINSILQHHADAQPTKSWQVKWVHNYASLTECDVIKGECLVCFNTGIIVPAEVLRKVGRDSYNFHLAPPEYPGRDPHHWAVNRSAESYGVTCHVMTALVDDGQILCVRRFPIAPDDQPADLLRKACPVALEMLMDILPSLLLGNAQPNGIEWGSFKAKRSDSLRMRGEKGFENF